MSNQTKGAVWFRICGRLGKMTRLSPLRPGAAKGWDDCGARRRGLVLLVVLLGSLMPCLFLQQSFRLSLGSDDVQVAHRHWLTPEHLQVFDVFLKSATTQNNEVVIALAGKTDYLVEDHDLLANFFFFAKDAAVAEHLLLVALDPATASKATEIGYGYVLPFFNATVPHIKYQLLAEAVGLGYMVVFSSLDMVWLQKPWEALAGGQDIQLIQQRPPAVATPGGPSRSRRKVHALVEGESRRKLQEEDVSGAGTSVAFLRPSKATLAFLRTMAEAVASQPGIEEEKVLNGVLKGGSSALTRKVSLGGGWSWESIHRGRFWDGLAEVQPDPPSRGEFLAGAFDVSGGSFSPRNVRYRFREGRLWAADRALVRCLRNQGGHVEQGTEQGGVQQRRRRRGLKDGSESCNGGRGFMYYFEELEHNGLNNQRQELRTALAMAEHMGRTLILPRFYRQHKQAAPVLLDYFFDYDAFEAEFLDTLPGSMLEVLFPDWQQLPIQNIDISTDPRPPPDAPWLGRLRNFTASRYHFGATEAEVTEWFGSNSDPLLVFYSAFRRFGQFKDAAKQLAFDQRVYRGMAPHPVTANLRNQMVAALREMAPNRTYNCFHLRRGDTFLTLHPEYEKSLEEIVELLKVYLPVEELLYISTDASTEETRVLFSHGGYKEVHFLGDVFPSWGWTHVTNENGEETMRLGQIDQAVCSQGRLFVGNLWSTFTLHIGFIRRMNGAEQVCQDIYAREEEVGSDTMFY